MVVGLADNAGVALAGVGKVVILMEDIERDSIESMLTCKFLVLLRAHLCANHFNLYQSNLKLMIVLHKHSSKHYHCKSPKKTL